MDFLKLSEERYSVRKFSNKAVEKEKIEAILHAGQVAPTACNRQPQKILVIKSADGLEKLNKCTRCHFGPTLAILTCYDKSLCWKRSYDGKTSGDIDASIVTTHMMLEAANLGIGFTWVMYFIPEAVRVEFQLPDNYVPVNILEMGYPADDTKEDPARSDIKDLKETVSYDKF